MPSSDPQPTRRNPMSNVLESIAGPQSTFSIRSASPTTSDSAGTASRQGESPPGKLASGQPVALVVEVAEADKELLETIRRVPATFEAQMLMLIHAELDAHHDRIQPRDH